jgi:hypothetical protein
LGRPGSKRSSQGFLSRVVIFGLSAKTGVRAENRKTTVNRKARKRIAKEIVHNLLCVSLRDLGELRG